MKTGKVGAFFLITSVYFSLPVKLKSYSGVATICRKSSNCNHASYPISAVDHFIDRKDPLDVEGRVMITSHKMFTLFNVYFPHGRDEERKEFKQKFYRSFSLKVLGLIKNGEKVIIVGDVNCAREVNDVADPEWYDPKSESVVWFESFLKEAGLIDLFRHFYPGIKQKVNLMSRSRTSIHVLEQSNRCKGWKSRYETRLHSCLSVACVLVLCMLPYNSRFQDCTLMTEEKGSDHCPVRATMLSVNPDTQESLILSRGPDDPIPECCSRFWTKSQSSITSFMSKKRDETPPAEIIPPKPKKQKVVQSSISSFIKRDLVPRDKDVESREFEIEESYKVVLPPTEKQQEVRSLRLINRPKPSLILYSLRGRHPSVGMMRRARNSK